MTLRRPLVRINGRTEQLPGGDALAGVLTPDDAGIIERIEVSFSGEVTTQLACPLRSSAPLITDGYNLLDITVETIVGQVVELTMVVPYIGISSTMVVSMHMWADTTFIGTAASRVTTGATSGNSLNLPTSFVATGTSTRIRANIGAHTASPTVSINGYWNNGAKPYLLLKRYGMASLIAAAPGDDPGPGPEPSPGAAASRLKTICIAGDSVTGNNSSSGSREKFKDIGHMTWAQALSGQRLYYDKDWNFGVGGDNSADLLARLDAVLAADTDYVFVSVGGNDVTHSLTVAQTCANLEEIWDRCYAAGKFVIASMLYPRGTATTWTSAHKAKSAAINNYIQQAKHRRKLFEVVNPAPLFTDYSNTNGNSLAVMTTDGVHPGVYGAFILGQAIAKCFERLEPERPDLFDDYSNVYSASNPYGNLIPNGLLYGVGGSVGAGASGVVADSTSLAVVGSIPVACSKGVNEHGMPTQKFTLSGSSGAGGAQVRLTMVGDAVVPSSQVEALMRVKLAGTVGLAPPDLEVRVIDSSAHSTYANAAKLTQQASLESMRLPDGSYELVFRTPRLDVPSNAASVQLIFIFGAYPSTPVSGDIEISQAWLRTVMPEP